MKSPDMLGSSISISPSKLQATDEGICKLKKRDNIPEITFDKVNERSIREGGL